MNTPVRQSPKSAADAFHSSRAVAAVRLPLLRAIAFGFALACLAFAAKAQQQAGGIQFQLQVDQTKVGVGEPITLSLVVRSSGSTSLDVAPTLPDFGGLRVLSGPADQLRTEIINGSVSVIRQFQWQVAGPREGEFIIGPSQLTIDGQTYTSKPVTITVSPASASASLPESLRKDGILSARTRDAATNKNLDGKLFLLQQVYNNTPYVSQPVEILYKLYKDPRLNISGLNEQMPDFNGALTEELFHVQQVQWQRLQVDGQAYDVARILTLALTPTKAGDLTLDGYSMGGKLLIPRSRRTSPDDPFQAMQEMMGDDPLFGDPFNRGTDMQLPSPQIQMKVRPLPEAGKPANFTGTVGEYTIKASVDKTKASEDDLITLRATVEGRGAIELATPPTLQTKDFDLIGQDNKTEKTKTEDSIGGKKTFEFVLRAKHAGALTLPAIEYPVFNPWKEQYESLSTQPVSMLITPGTSPRATAPAANGARGAAPPTGLADLHYLKGIVELKTERSEPLLDDPRLWIAEAAGLGLWLAAWRRRRAIQRRDPSHARRQGAWSRFEKRIRAIKSQPAEDPRETAAALESAARDCIADHFNLSADGLTRPEIERLLRERAMPAERVQRICDLLDQCAALRYAPTAAAPEDLRQWGDELGRLLKEGLAS